MSQSPTPTTPIVEVIGNDYRWHVAQIPYLKKGDVIRHRDKRTHVENDRYVRIKDRIYREIRSWIVTEAPTAADPYGYSAEPYDYDIDDNERMLEEVSPFAATEFLIARLAGPLVNVARHCLDMSNAPNFMSFRLDRYDGDEEPLEVVIRRWSGQTPEQGRRAALLEIDKQIKRGDNYMAAYDEMQVHAQNVEAELDVVTKERDEARAVKCASCMEDDISHEEFFNRGAAAARAEIAAQFTHEDVGIIEGALNNYGPDSVCARLLAVIIRPVPPSSDDTTLEGDPVDEVDENDIVTAEGESEP